MFNVLIACLDNWNTTVEIPYVLKQAGCNVHVYCSAQSWLLANSYHDKWIESSADKDTYITELIALAQSGAYNWIIPGDDPLLKHLNDTITDDTIYSKLLPVLNIKHREMLSSKKGLSDFCLQNGITTPGYCIYNGSGDLAKIKALNFPVINKVDFSWGGINMFVSDTYEEFVASLDKIPTNENTMIQEYIQGEEVPVEALFYGGELLVCCTSKILLTDKGPFTYSTRRLYYNNEALKLLLIELGKTLKLNGFVNITYLYHPKRDTYYLIEADARPNSWMPYGKFFGRDFSEAVKRIVNGDYINGYKDMPMPQPLVEVALFYKDVRRSLWRNEIKGILQWKFNYRSYRRYLPEYDTVLKKKLYGELKKIVAYKWGKMLGKKMEYPN